MKVYVGFAVADSMFPESCKAQRMGCPLPMVLKLIEVSREEPVINACNRSHTSTLVALKIRHGIDLTVGLQERPPVAKLEAGDVFLVISPRGLPRLTDRHEYTPEEIGKALFSFGLWEVLE